MDHAKILLQNTNKELGSSLRCILRNAGYTVLTIKNRQGLFNLASKFKPALVIIEGSIALQDSPEVVKKLKDTLDVKILATSCDDNRKQLLKNGFDDCLNLPYRTDEIQHVIEGLLAA